MTILVNNVPVEADTAQPTPTIAGTWSVRAKTPNGHPVVVDWFLTHAAAEAFAAALRAADRDDTVEHLRELARLTRHS